MTVENKKLLDNTGCRVLAALQQDARLSFVELGRRVGLSAPAVAERVRRMEEAGIITGYNARVAPGKIGRPVLAFTRLQISRDQYTSLTNVAQKMPEVLECHHLAGADAFLVKIAASSVEHLEQVLDRLSEFGATNTSIVLSSPVIKAGPAPQPSDDVSNEKLSAGQS
jgi:Lrp/AsnC family leucine-responsive transcriptional regulator